MKKFMSIMLGLGLILGTVSVTFGKDDVTKFEKKKKKKEPKTDKK